jgi:hypothetical protein
MPKAEVLQLFSPGCLELLPSRACEPSVRSFSRAELPFCQFGFKKAFPELPPLSNSSPVLSLPPVHRHRRRHHHAHSMHRRAVLADFREISSMLGGFQYNCRGNRWEKPEILPVALFYRRCAD